MEDNKMIDFNLQHKVSVFGEFSDIDVKPECTMKLIMLFKDYNFIPNMFQEVVGGILVSRPKFSTADGGWNINIANQRIDIENNRLIDGSINDLREFVQSSINFLDMLLSTFNKKVNRIALITVGMDTTVEPVKLNEAYSLLVKPIKSYTTNEPFEWGLRSVAKAPILIDDHEEYINIITILSRARGIIVQEAREVDTLNLQFDINTIENSDLRFTSADIRIFLGKMAEIRQRIFDELTEIIYG